MYIRKCLPAGRVTGFVPWATVRFHTEEIRDHFLRVAATLQTKDVEVGPMPEESRAALVRWRPGMFLGLNDIAYAHGGRIVAALMQRRGG